MAIIPPSRKNFIPTLEEAYEKARYRVRKHKTVQYVYEVTPGLQYVTSVKSALPYRRIGYIQRDFREYRISDVQS